MVPTGVRHRWYAPEAGDGAEGRIKEEEREEEQGEAVVVQDMDGRRRLESVDGVGEVRQERMEEGRLEAGGSRS